MVRVNSANRSEHDCNKIGSVYHIRKHQGNWIVTLRRGCRYKSGSLFFSYGCSHRCHRGLGRERKADERSEQVCVTHYTVGIQEGVMTRAEKDEENHESPFATEFPNGPICSPRRETDMC